MPHQPTHRGLAERGDLLEGEAGTRPQPPGPVYERSLGNSRGAAAGANGWVGTGRGCGASGTIAPWGLAAPLGAEPSLVLVPGLLWNSSRGGTGPGLLRQMRGPGSPQQVSFGCVATGLKGRDGTEETLQGMLRAERPSRSAPLPRMQTWADVAGSTSWGGWGGGRQGRGGENRGSGQASWPYPLGLLPTRCGPSSLARGSCHLLERQEQKSRGSSLFRHLETRT